MMQCEICGAEIKGEAQHIKIGSSELSVCKLCARHGTVVEMAKASDTTVIKSGEQPHPVAAKANSRLYEEMDRDIAEGMDIEVDYGRRIKVAREKAGLKQVELAKRINEKLSLLRKIENEEMIPDDAVMRKIERALKPFL
jgi:putative transcription factor